MLTREYDLSSVVFYWLFSLEDAYHSEDSTFDIDQPLIDSESRFTQDSIAFYIEILIDSIVFIGVVEFDSIYFFVVFGLIEAQEFNVKDLRSAASCALPREAFTQAA